MQQLYKNIYIYRKGAGKEKRETFSELSLIDIISMAILISINRMKSICRENVYQFTYVPGFDYVDYL